MSYQILEHTADFKILVQAINLPELFLESMRAMAEIMQPAAKEQSADLVEEIKIESGDLTSLLIDFLNEVLYLSIIQKVVFTEGVVEFYDNSVKANIKGAKVENFAKDIKAVTYHQAEVKESNGVWQTIIVFDI